MKAKDSTLVSVIVPVYNVERYIDECLNSIISQSYENIEVILVDDGSTDDSGTKCDLWAKRDKRIKVIHKKNQGLNDARKDGFKRSTGEYVVFLDSDDVFHKQNVKISMQEMLSNNADIVSYAFTKFSDDSGIANQASSSPKNYETRILEDKKDILEYILLENNIFPGSHAVTAWGKLYRRSLIELVDWKKSNYRSYEDNFWTPQLFGVANRVVLLSCPLNFYRRNEEYGVQGKTLGNRLVGNTYKGKTVGYVELIHLAFEYYESLAKQYNVDIQRDLHDKRFLYMKSRFDSLIGAGLVSSENNLQYLQEVWVEINKRCAALQEQNTKLMDENAALQEQNTKLMDENAALQEQNTGLIGSLSWRATSPLRFLAKIMRSTLGQKEVD